MTKSNVSSFSY